MNYHCYPMLYENLSSKILYLKYETKIFEDCMDGILLNSIPKSKLKVVYYDGNNFRHVDESEFKKVKHENNIWFLWQPDEIFVKLNYPHKYVSVEFQNEDKTIKLSTISRISAEYWDELFPAISQ